MSFNQQIDDQLDTLGDDDPDELQRVLQIYETNDLLAVVTKRLLDVEEGGGGGGGSIPSGSGPPGGSVTPSGFGALYVDSDVGSLYIAIGATDADWVSVGGFGTNEVAGAQVSTNLDATLVAGSGRQAALTDVDSAANTGNGVYWHGGQDKAYIESGPSGEFIGTLQDEAGTMTLAAGGLIFPTSDPGVAGAWWDDAGTLTKSSG